MQCPSCRTGDSRTVDSRQGAPFVIRRRRQCDACQHRFTSYEIVENAIDQALVLTLEIFMVSGRLESRSRAIIMCACGNEARYVVDGEGNPRYCALCDLTLNNGKGERR